MTLLEEFAAFAATRSGPYQTEDPCRCPMAEFALHKWPEATFVSAGETSITAWTKGVLIIGEAEFPPRFFSLFVETAGTWEELARRLRRAICTDYRLEVTHKTLREALRAYGVDLPDNVKIFVNVPGGGDWSNTSLDIDAQCPIIVTWSTKEESHS